MMNKKAHIFVALLSTALLLAGAVSVNAQRYVGGDLSMLPYYETAGSTYYDTDGSTLVTANYADLIYYLKAKGWNSMRVRLFVDPETYKSSDATYWNEGARQTLNDVRKLGKRIKDAGLKFLLDLHYSDTWTDPDKHLAPQRWTSSSAYADSMYAYTKEVLQTLVAYGATPDFIQVGNEVNNGMLWDNLWANQATNVVYANSTGTVMTNFISYIKQGCKACREVCPSAKIIFHVAMDYNATLDYANWAAKTWPATLATNSVDYDIIGLSYYPYYHGPLNYLTTLLTYLQTNYPNKEVQLVEVGYPHAYYPSTYSYDYTTTYADTEAGQKNFATDLVSALADYSNVTGLYWWFPEANERGNSGSKVTTDWYNYGLWDNSSGEAMEAVDVLNTFVPTIGNVDNTTGWWTAFSDYYTIQPNYKQTFTFTNYSGKGENWHNWIVAITTDADRSAEGYSEYVVLRADNYGWQGGNNTSDNTWYTSLTSNYNWTTFKDDMDGSDVVMTITRYGSKVTIRADVTTTSGATYYEQFVITCGDGTQNIRAFLTTEKGHLTNLTASTEANPVYTNAQTIATEKGDITSLINGDFESNADGWTGYGNYWANQTWTTRSWRGNSQNAFIERASSGTMSYTLSNMPAGTYKVVAAARAYNGGVIQAAVAGTAGTSITGVGDGATAGNMEINTNGVEMPYNSLGGFTTDGAGHNWRWISATGTLAADGDLTLSFNCTGTSWMAIDDVHLYCTSLDGISYTTSTGTLTGTTLVSTLGDATHDRSVVTCDIITTNPNAIIRTNSEVTTAAGEALNNNMYNSARISKLVLYDGYDFSYYGTVTTSTSIGYDNGATLYRDFPADTWCTLTVPFCPTDLDYVLQPSALSDDGTLSFASAPSSGLNDEPLLVKSTAGTTHISGTRTSAVGSNCGDMTSGTGVPMMGVYAAATVPQTTDTYIYYVVGSDNNLHKVTGSGVSIGAFRAYFTLDATTTNNAPSSLGIKLDDETESISSVEAPSSPTRYYNLHGQAVAQPQKGLYIANGRKVIIR